MNIYEHDETAVGEVDPNPRWVPVLNGDIYCSPACGGKCKKSAYDQAVVDSNEMASLLGAGWKPIVFENLGWYWKIEKGDLELRPALPEGCFSATLQFQLESNYYFSAKDADPRKAIQNVRSQLLDIIQKLERQHASSGLDPIALALSK